MSSTTYATLQDLKDRLNITSTTSDGKLQSMLDSAAVIVDQQTRGYRVGYEAFSESASETRYFNDVLQEYGFVAIDDCLSVTQVSRGGTVLDPLYYQLSPYNNPNGMADRLETRGDSVFPFLALMTTSSWYHFPYRGVGAKQFAITGTWGFCTQAKRPPVIREATLLIATRMYERANLSNADLTAILASGGSAGIRIDPIVEAMLGPLRLEGRVAFA